MGRNQALADLSDYDPEEGKCSKVGQLAKGRDKHAMSLVPKEIADYCVWYMKHNIFKLFYESQYMIIYSIYYD